MSLSLSLSLSLRLSVRLGVYIFSVLKTIQCHGAVIHIHEIVCVSLSLSVRLGVFLFFEKQFSEMVRTGLRLTFDLQSSIPLVRACVCVCVRVCEYVCVCVCVCVCV